MSIPRPLRPLLGLLMAVLILEWAGILDFNIDWRYLMPALPPSALIIWYLVKRVIARGRKRGGLHVRRPILALRLKLLEVSASEDIARILRERAIRTGLDYVVATLVGEDGSDTLLFIGGRRDAELIIEREILTTLASTLRSFRIEPLGEVSVNALDDLFYLFRPSRRRAPFIVLDSSRERSTRSSAERGIMLGRSLSTPTPIPIIISEDDIEGHIAIFGSTGTGKSTTAAVIACRAWQELSISSVIIDWTGEYTRLLSPCRARVLDPLKGDVSVWLPPKEADEIVLEVMGSALDLTGPQLFMLQRTLEKEPRSIGELLSLIEGYPEESKWDREVKRGLLRKIGILAERYPQAFTYAGGSLLGHWSGIVIVNASSIGITLARRAFALLLLASEFYRRVDVGGGSRALYIVDEAHNLLLGEGVLLEKLAAESRKYGMSMVFITQSPYMAERLMLNTATKIVHALRSARDKTVVADALSLDRGSIERIGLLNTGEALVYAPSIGSPVFVSIELPEPLAKSLYNPGI